MERGIHWARQLTFDQLTFDQLTFDNLKGRGLSDLKRKKEEQCQTMTLSLTTLLSLVFTGPPDSVYSCMAVAEQFFSWCAPLFPLG